MESITVCGHIVEREIDGNELRYRCVDCELAGKLVADFERYGCPPQ